MPLSRRPDQQPSSLIGVTPRPLPASPLCPTQKRSLDCFFAALPSLPSNMGPPAFATPLALARARVSSTSPSLCPRMQADPSEPKPPPKVMTPKPLIPKNVVVGAPPRTTATWANVWLKDFFEAKGMGSIIGWDLRPGTLKGPEGGAGTCGNCSGSGKTTCAICFGNAFFGPDGEVKCKSCSGNTTVECSTCYGSGKQLDIVGDWAKINFVKFLRK